MLNINFTIKNWLTVNWDNLFVWLPEQKISTVGVCTHIANDFYSKNNIN